MTAHSGPPYADRIDRDRIASLLDPLRPAAVTGYAVSDTSTYLDRATKLLDQRRIRLEAFGQAADLFGDAAWDIMLGLFIAHERGEAMPATLAAAQLPGSPGRRWLMALEQRGLTRGWIDHHDGTRKVGLTPEAMTMMLQYLDRV